MDDDEYGKSKKISADANNVLAEAVAKSPDRFGGFITLLTLTKKGFGLSWRNVKNWPCLYIFTLHPLQPEISAYSVSVCQARFLVSG